ncbi:IS256 family transposase [Candidatus Poribacteria bacterium]|jgi:transposase-like protein|nr:IS256 family transposase [Candidatus Poribacteria bacterium]
MDENTRVSVGQPEVSDPLTELLRQGSRALIARAVEAEFAAFLTAYDAALDDEGRRQVVRNGYLPERAVQTGIGSVVVRVPRARDRSGSGIVFHSNLLPPYLRRTKSIEELIPWLYLKGVSTGDFSEALVALLGVNAVGLSASTVSRLKETWTDEYEEWNQRDLSGKRYVYFWVDGVHPQARMEHPNPCLLVIIGADASGRKELVGVWDGYRESEQSWLELLLDLKRRSLTMAPKVAVGDGAMGFWKALMQVYPSTRHQRCWVHKTKNVLNKLPKSLQAHAKEQIHAIWMAPTREEAEAAFDYFIAAYDAKYPKAVACLTKDREELLVFYDFPGDHWRHLRTTNPIESTFATIRLRTAKTRGCLSRKTALAMVYKLALSAQRGWRRLNNSELLTDVVGGVTFKDGVRTTEDVAPTKEAA